VDLAQLSNKLDTSTNRIEDRLEAIQTAVSAARLELPQDIRNLGEQGQGSLNQAIAILQLK
jgi:hypothetical protein